MCGHGYEANFEDLVFGGETVNMVSMSEEDFDAALANARREVFDKLEEQTKDIFEDAPDFVKDMTLQMFESSNIIEPWEVGHACALTMIETGKLAFRGKL